MKRIIVGISLIISSALVHAASFDCAKASTRIEKAICGDEQLSKLDSDLLAAYKAAQTNATDPDKLKSEQKAWLQTSRNKCEDAGCIRKAYEDRINELKPAEVSAPAAQVATEAAVAKNESLPEVKQEENPVETVPPAVAATPEPTPQAQTSEPTTTPKSASAGEPTSTVADILFGVAGLIGIALVAGLIKPKLVIRWSDKPTRLKVLGYLLPVLLIVSVAAPVSRTKERAEYDKQVDIASKAKAKADAEEKAKSAERARVSAQSNPAPQARSTAAGSQQVPPVLANYRIAKANFKNTVEAASRSKAYGDPQFPCQGSVDKFYSDFVNEVEPFLLNLSQRHDNDVLESAMKMSTAKLNLYSNQIAHDCRLN